MSPQSQTYISVAACIILALTTFGNPIGISASAVVFIFIFFAICRIILNESTKAVFLKTIRPYRINLLKVGIFLIGITGVSVLLSGSLILLFLYIVDLLLIGLYILPLIEQNLKK